MASFSGTEGRSIASLTRCSYRGRARRGGGRVRTRVARQQPWTTRPAAFGHTSADDAHLSSRGARGEPTYSAGRLPSHRPADRAPRGAPTPTSPSRGTYHHRPRGNLATLNHADHHDAHDIGAIGATSTSPSSAPTSEFAASPTPRLLAPPHLSFPASARPRCATAPTTARLDRPPVAAHAAEPRQNPPWERIGGVRSRLPSACIKRFVREPLGAGFDSDAFGSLRVPTTGRATPRPPMSSGKIAQASPPFAAITRIPATLLCVAC